MDFADSDDAHHIFDLQPNWLGSPCRCGRFAGPNDARADNAESCFVAHSPSSGLENRRTSRNHA